MTIQNNIIAENPNSTVVAEYVSTTTNAKKYKSEAELEAEFIHILQSNGYEYLPIKNNNDLLSNLRRQISRLNNYNFSDSEWKKFMDDYAANKNDSIEQKTTKIQEDYIYNLSIDSGDTKNIRIIDKDNIHKNHLQIINQYETDTGNHPNRYDVSVLVNGLPLVHIELKRHGVVIREAFNQINRYQRDSFWADSGLFEFVQLFVISNGTHTKYYSNTTRKKHIDETGGHTNKKKTSNSFEFTSWWADRKNKRITDLTDFAKTFFSKHSILSILTKYCVFTSDHLLLVMRPYQIAATEQILNKIAMATNHHQLGTIDAGGYVWHTTGSGKTLTSFKTAQIASNLPNIDKVLFVVDRKDLDYQTMKEYDKFAEGSANGNTSTSVLEEQLIKPNNAILKSGKENTPIVITTIQKLDRFITKNKNAEIFSKHVILIFDECHRSQFGNMHTKIIKSFKKYHIFGFTGTPIFAANTIGGGNPQLKTTEQAFGQKLHTYTIVDAINDENVLPFRIDYINTLKMRDEVTDKQVHAIDIEKVANDPKRITQVVTYILEHFDQKTKRNEHYLLKDKRMFGFNSIFAVSSIESAKKYYTEFMKQQEKLPNNKKLKIALIYIFGANDAESDDGTLMDEDFDTSNLDKISRDFLDEAIAGYNKIFPGSFKTSGDDFQKYYKDLSERVKNREIDLLIVVNMFLTGFDATTLNTLWVDKNLRHHGLLQAFSRTNRILNSVKTFGNIVCFRDLEEATNEAIGIFGNREANGIVLLKSYDDYYNGWEKDGEHQNGYIELINELRDKFPLPVHIVGEAEEKEFISLYGAILRIKNILSAFDDFLGCEILTERDFQDYQSTYLDLYDKLRKDKYTDKEVINDDIVFEMELVKQVTINIDYILQLVAKYHKSKMKDKEILTTIDKAINASVELRSKKELIERFINTLNTDTNVDKDWHIFANDSRKQDLDKIIEEEGLEPERTRKFIDNSFNAGEIKPTGTDFAKILPQQIGFGAARGKKKMIVLEKLHMFFEKYLGV
ncbi:MAG: type I restriction endonuclease subunit R [Rickettsiales bacterium]|jgi:type I restriction enzyme R subunit|nr:type I restriction endonuclease subunit R [Rickettsiales bacterium]